MKVVILAGGYGTRLMEETARIPKPLVPVGNKPILWHIMKIYSHYGFNDFIISCGYKGYLIKEYFANYFLHMSDVTFDMQKNKMEIHNNFTEPWRVTVVDTGEDTQTGGRIKRIIDYIDDDYFFMTYGDCVGDINIRNLHDFAIKAKTLATVTAVQPPGRYGIVKIRGNAVADFEEKPTGDGNWINGGFFVLNKKIKSYIKNDGTIWEKDPMQKLVEKKQLSAFKHDGFWRPMDTLRDKQVLDDLWAAREAPWKVWK